MDKPPSVSAPEQTVPDSFSLIGQPAGTASLQEIQPATHAPVTLWPERPVWFGGGA